MPYQRQLLVKSIRVSITRANGSAGSALITMRVRDGEGQAYRAIRQYDLAHTTGITDIPLTGIVINQLADIKFRVDSVSDNSTIASAQFEGLLIRMDKAFTVV